jgi:hypothetical protein
MAASVFKMREEGDANFYSIHKDDKWLMRIQVNGELHPFEQIDLVSVMMAALSERQTKLEKADEFRNTY